MFLEYVWNFLHSTDILMTIIIIVWKYIDVHESVHIIIQCGILNLVNV